MRRRPPWFFVVVGLAVGALLSSPIIVMFYVQHEACVRSRDAWDGRVALARITFEQVVFPPTDDTDLIAAQNAGNAKRADQLRRALALQGKRPHC